MANFIEESFDENQEVENLFEEQNTEPLEEQAPEPEGEEIVAEEPAVEQEEEELPSKYKGKSVAEIIRMHQEAEKLIGRQAQEVGEVRKLADDLIKRQLEGKSQVEEATKEDEIDFLDDPKQAISKAVDKHPAIAEARQQALQMKQMQIVQKLASSFPDFQQTVQDPQFTEWVTSSPVRLKLYNEANTNFDFDSAAELLGTWQQIRGTKAEAAKAVPSTVKQERKQSVKSAAVDTGSVGVSSKKTYKREDIRNLMIRDPERYQAMQPELMAAYAEGRVI